MSAAGGEGNSKDISCTGGGPLFGIRTEKKERKQQKKEKIEAN